MRWLQWTHAAKRKFDELGVVEKHEVRLALAELRNIPNYPEDCPPIGNSEFHRKDTPLFRISIAFELTDEVVHIAYITAWNP